VTAHRLIAALISQIPAAQATPMTFVANLSGANENPVVNTPGTGLATVILDPIAQTLQVSATFSGLTVIVAARRALRTARSARPMGFWSVSGKVCAS